MNLNLLGMATWQIVMLVVLGVLVLAFAIILVILPVKIWFIALVSGSHISMGRLIGMKLRKINVKQIVDAYDCLVNKLSIRKTANKIGVSIKTAFVLRFKIISCLKNIVNNTQKVARRFVG